MLKLSLLPEEYLTINEDIVVQLIRVAGGRASLAIHADREIPIVRGTVLEQEGKERPACLLPPSGRKARYYRDQVFRWNDDRERAVRTMKRTIQQLAEKGCGREAEVLSTQLERIIPAFWEEDLSAR